MERQSARDIARATIAELRLQRCRVLRVEHAVTHLALADGPNLASDAAAGLQEIDVLAQSIDALANCLETIVEAIPDNPDIDISAALRAIPLREMAARIAGSDHRPPKPQSGVVDLF